MGKYIRKAKTTGEVAVMELSQPSLSGVRTRAKKLALQQQSSSPPPAGSYIQLRSRRLEKPPVLVNYSNKRQKQRDTCVVKNSNSNSTVWVDGPGSGGHNKEEDGGEEIVHDNKDLGCFGDNVLEFEGRERSTRESTPCSLIREPDTIRTPGSTTRPTTISTETKRRTQNSTHRQIPTAHEMDEFFSGAEEERLKQFIEKYNFDPVKEKPLPGRYEWEMVEP
ncbi:CDI domain-containing protein [Cephalotus follicularis]|uniref:Cyclin-dependent kinase inhibitor n=1 Tax=Cephalotus follicularis TaxID=3775 RepID=A0A1Q3ATG2_CEPFO|nr:CDI domain-containing protein [Cephalotus follicularis]